MTKMSAVMCSSPFEDTTPLDQCHVVTPLRQTTLAEQRTVLQLRHQYGKRRLPVQTLFRIEIEPKQCNGGDVSLKKDSIQLHFEEMYQSVWYNRPWEKMYGAFKVRKLSQPEGNIEVIVNMTFLAKDIRCLLSMSNEMSQRMRIRSIEMWMTEGPASYKTVVVFGSDEQRAAILCTKDGVLTKCRWATSLASSSSSVTSSVFTSYHPAKEDGQPPDYESLIIY
jgi:hypothetical protein